VAFLNSVIALPFWPGEYEVGMKEYGVTVCDYETMFQISVFRRCFKRFYHDRRRVMSKDVYMWVYPDI
jgi:hypothetical protein